MGPGSKQLYFADIQKLLKNSYRDGESDIIKEVIQNANDADATDLLIVYLDDGLATLNIGNKEDCFFTQPLLLLINNGRFCQQDSIAIANIGSLDREEKKGIDSIGKFGLGLKSLFRVTDLFAWTGKTNTGTFVTETMNLFLQNALPKPTLEYYGNIEKVFLKENNKDRLLEKIRSFVPESREILDSDESLCFFVPLRKKQPLVAKVVQVSREPNDCYSKDRHFFHKFGEGLKEKSEKLCELFGDILPSLNSLRSIYYWESGKFCAQVQQTDPLMQYPPVDELQLEEDIRTQKIWRPQAHIEMKVLGKSYSHQNVLTTELLIPYDKFKPLPNNPVIKSLTDLESLEIGEGEETEKLWPHLGPDPVMSDPDKALPHAACMIKIRPKSSLVAKLKIQWGLFLPLKSDQFEDSLSGDQDISILLHGVFFPDDGRNYFVGNSELNELLSSLKMIDPPMTSSQFKIFWNMILLKEGVSLSIYDILTRILKKRLLDFKQVRDILSVFRKDEPYRSLQPYILRGHSIAPEFYTSQSNKLSLRWSIFEYSPKTIKLPSVSNSRSNRSTPFGISTDGELFLPDWLTSIFNAQPDSLTLNHEFYQGLGSLSTQQDNTFIDACIAALDENTLDRGIFINELFTLNSWELTQAQRSTAILYFKDLISCADQQLLSDKRFYNFWEYIDPSKDRSIILSLCKNINEMQIRLNRFASRWLKNRYDELIFTPDLQTRSTKLDQSLINHILQQDKLCISGRFIEGVTRSFPEDLIIEALIWVQQRPHSLEVRHKALSSCIRSWINTGVEIPSNLALYRIYRSVKTKQGYRFEFDTLYTAAELSSLDLCAIYPSEEESKQRAFLLHRYLNHDIAYIASELRIPELKRLTDLEFISDLILSTEVLAPLDPNEGVLNKLATEMLAEIIQSQNAKCILAMRYIIHRCPEQRANLDMLYINQLDNSHYLYLTLSLVPEKWRYIDSTYAQDTLSRREQATLGIQTLNRIQVEELVLNQDYIEPSETILSIRDDLLNDGDLDIEVLKKLPIHKTIDGCCVSLHNHCFIVERFKDLPLILSQQITLIEQNEHPKNYKDKFNLNLWSRNSLLRSLINHSGDSQERFEQIIQLLKKYDRLSTNMLTSEAWIYIPSTGSTHSLYEFALLPSNVVLQEHTRLELLAAAQRQNLDEVSGVEVIKSKFKSELDQSFNTWLNALFTLPSPNFLEVQSLLDHCPHDINLFPTDLDDIACSSIPLIELHGTLYSALQIVKRQKSPKLASIQNRILSDLTEGLILHPKKPKGVLKHPSVSKLIPKLWKPIELLSRLISTENSYIYYEDIITLTQMVGNDIFKNHKDVERQLKESHWIKHSFSDEAMSPNMIGILQWQGQCEYQPELFDKRIFLSDVIVELPKLNKVKELFSVIGSQEVLDAILISTEPWSFMHDVIEIMYQLPSISRPELSTVKWIQGGDEPLSPKRLLLDQRFKEDLKTVKAWRTFEDFCTEVNLSNEIMRARIKELIGDEDDQLSSLLQEVSDFEIYHLGQLGTIIDETSAEPPVQYRILLYEELPGLKWVRAGLVPVDTLDDPFSKERTVNLLNRISMELKKTPCPTMQAVFDHLLEVLSNFTDLEPTELPPLLKNSGGKWCSVSELSWPSESENIEKKQILINSYASHLVKHYDRWVSLRVPVEDLAEEKPLEEWIDMLGTLGISSEQRALFCFLIRRPDLAPKGRLNRRKIYDYITKKDRDRLAATPIKLTVNQENSSFIPAINNQMFIANIDTKNYRNLLLSSKRSDASESLKLIDLTGLRDTKPERVNRLIKNTLIKILDLINDSSAIKQLIHIFWDHYADRSHLIILERLSILDRIETVLYDQLQPIEISSISDRINEYRQRLLLTQDNKRETVLQDDQITNSIVSNRRRMLESLSTGLISVRVMKLYRDHVEKTLRYRPRQILFELAQNADDAMIQRPKDINDSTSFYVNTSKSSLSIWHFGRPINEFYDEKGKGLGWHEDLANILRLGSSTKLRQAEATEDQNSIPIKLTGKFGLGFKSCYLFCDEPWIYSDRLSFKISSGVIPVQLTDKEVRSIHRPLKTPEINVEDLIRRDHTLIQLKRSSEISSEVQDEVVSYFREGAELLSIFAKSIKQVIIDGVETPKLSPLIEENGLFIDVMRSTERDNLLYLVISTQRDQYRVAHVALPCHATHGRLNVDENGELQGELPALWNTAPIDCKISVPFHINGSFEISSDRNEFPANENNEQRLLEVASSIDEAIYLLWRWRNQSLWEYEGFAENVVTSILRALFINVIRHQPEQCRTAGDYPNLIAHRILGRESKSGHLSCFESGLDGQLLSASQLLSEDLRELPLQYAELLKDQALSFPLITREASIYATWLSKHSQAETSRTLTLVETLKLVGVVEDNTLCLEPDFVKAHCVLHHELAQCRSMVIKVRSAKQELKNINELFLDSTPIQLVGEEYIPSFDYGRYKSTLLKSLQVSPPTEDDVIRVVNQRLKDLNGDEYNHLMALLEQWQNTLNGEVLPEALKSKRDPGGDDEGEDEKELKKMIGLAELTDSRIQENFGIAVKSCWEYLKKRDKNDTADLSKTEFDQTNRKFFNVTLYEEGRTLVRHIMPRSAQRGYMFLNPHLYRTLEQSNQLLYLYLGSNGEAEGRYQLVNSYKELSQRHPNHVLLRIKLPTDSATQRNLFEHISKINEDPIEISALMEVNSLQSMDGGEKHSLYEEVYRISNIRKTVEKLKKNNQNLDM